MRSVGEIALHGSLEPAAYRDGGAIEIEGHPALLRQGVGNLVDNAIKYTPAKGHIRVGVTRRPSGEAVLEVEDDGPGIAAVHQQRIFDRFYRVDPGRSRSEGRHRARA
jgi:signal transduction histidine kinase